MYSKFPFSMENIPRQKSFGCLSLKFGCIFSALTIILYTVLSLANCMATLDRGRPGVINLDNLENVLAYGFAIGVILAHCVTLVLTTIMVVGTLKERPHLMRPWIIWTSCTVIAHTLLIIFWTTVNMVFDHMDPNSVPLYLAALLGLVLRFYMLMIVASYYKQLVEELEGLKTLLKNENWYHTV